jgi:hypothetical protein
LLFMFILVDLAKDFDTAVPSGDKCTPEQGNCTAIQCFRCSLSSFRSHF